MSAISIGKSCDLLLNNSGALLDANRMRIRERKTFAKRHPDIPAADADMERQNGRLGADSESRSAVVKNSEIILPDQPPLRKHQDDSTFLEKPERDFKGYIQPHAALGRKPSR